MSRTTSALSELEGVPEVSEGIQRLRVCEESPLDVFVGILRPGGTPVLQLELANAAVVPVHAFRCKGLTINAELMGKTSGDGIRYTLALADASSQHLFIVVCDDLLGVVDSASSPREALSALLGRLRHWSDFFSKRATGLSAEEQQGLFGELWIIREMLAPYGARDSVAAWTGPNGANQDFQWHDAALEVKSTAANPSLSVRISNVKQLDDDVLTRLALVIVELDRLKNGGTTLPEMVASTRQVLAEVDPEAAIDFSERVTRAGYVDGSDEQYSATGYVVRQTRTYEVAGGFPRLCVRDLPEGVGALKYEVQVSAMGPFETDHVAEFARFLERRTDDGPE